MKPVKQSLFRQVLGYWQFWAVVSLLFGVVALMMISGSGSDVASKSIARKDAGVALKSVNNDVGCHDLSKPDYYRLLSDETCFNILVSDTTLDCDGFKLSGGIHVADGLSNVVVKNCVVVES